jgi:AcrR family transcriptional regulator
MTQKIDLRVLRTKKAISQAFLTLVNSKGYERITIQDISDEAFINRNTFYLHYIDKEDLMHKLTAEALEQLSTLLPKQKVNLFDQENIRKLIQDVLRAIQHDRHFYQTMIHTSGSSFFSEAFTLFLKSYISMSIVDTDSAKEDLGADTHTQIYMEYILSGFLGLARFCFKEGIDLSTKYVSELVFSLIYGNTLTILNVSKK